MDYFYVDKPVIITGKGKTVSDHVSNMSFTTTTQDITLNLTKGWNAILYEYQSTETGSSHVGYSIIETVTMSVGNPNFKWVYND